MPPSSKLGWVCLEQGLLLNLKGLAHGFKHRVCEEIKAFFGSPCHLVQVGAGSSLVHISNANAPVAYGLESSVLPFCLAHVGRRTNLALMNGSNMLVLVDSRCPSYVLPHPLSLADLSSAAMPKTLPIWGICGYDMVNAFSPLHLVSMDLWLLH